MSAPASRRPPPPRRPARLPARVYWFRRLLVLGAAVALVWSLTALVGGGDDAQETAATQDPPAADPTTTPPTTAPTAPPFTPPSTAAPRDGPRGHDNVDRKPRVVTTGLPDAQGGCLPEDVRVVPTVAPGGTGGADVSLRLSLTTAGSTTCRMEVDAGLLVVQVSTDGSAVWSTEQCPGAVPERTVVLRPGWVSALDVVWPGVYGDKSCTGTTRAAPPGSYAVEAAVYRGEPSRADFDLQAPPRPQDQGGGRPGGHVPGQGSGDTSGGGNGAVGDGAVGDGAVGDGAVGDGAVGDGAAGDGAAGDGTQDGVDYGGEDDASTGNHLGDSDSQGQ